MTKTPLINSRNQLLEKLTQWGFAVRVNNSMSWTLTADNDDEIEILVTAKKDGSLAEFKVVSVTKKYTNDVEHERVTIAVKRFLERKGMEILGKGISNAVSGARFDFVCQEDDEIVFVVANGTKYEENAFSDALQADRKDYEALAGKWLATNNPGGDVKVRFDICELLVVSDNRALIRHHINAFGEK